MKARRGAAQETMVIKQAQATPIINYGGMCIGPNETCINLYGWFFVRALIICAGPRPPWYARLIFPGAETKRPG